MQMTTTIAAVAATQLTLEFWASLVGATPSERASAVDDGQLRAAFAFDSEVRQ